MALEIINGEYEDDDLPDNLAGCVCVHLSLSAFVCLCFQTLTFWLFLFATHIDEEVDGAAGKQGESVESEMRGEEEQQEELTSDLPDS
jgi:hypothetical protein